MNELKVKHNWKERGESNWGFEQKLARKSRESEQSVKGVETAELPECNGLHMQVRLTQTHEADLIERPELYFYTSVVSKHSKSLLTNCPLPIYSYLFLSLRKLSISWELL